MANETRVMTGKVRLSFVHLFKPYAAEKGQEEKYSCTILVPKTDVQTKAKLDAAINAAISTRNSRYKSPTNFKSI